MSHAAWMRCSAVAAWHPSAGRCPLATPLRRRCRRCRRRSQPPRSDGNGSKRCPRALPRRCRIHPRFLRTSSPNSSGSKSCTSECRGWAWERRGAARLGVAANAPAPPTTALEPRLHPRTTAQVEQVRGAGGPHPHPPRRDRHARLCGGGHQRGPQGRGRAVGRRGGPAAHVLQHLPPAAAPGARGGGGGRRPARVHGPARPPAHHRLWRVPGLLPGLWHRARGGERAQAIPGPVKVQDGHTHERRHGGGRALLQLQVRPPPGVGRGCSGRGAGEQAGRHSRDGCRCSTPFWGD